MSATRFFTVFQEKIEIICQKLKKLYQKPFRFGQKLKDLKKKPQGYEALLGLLGLQKVHKKQAWLKDCT